MRRISIVVGALVAGMLLAVATAPGAGAAGSVKPKLVCVFADESGGYTAVWGYENTTGAVVEIAVGGDNRFDPTPRDRGQPTRFEEGSPTNVFTTTWDGTNLSWRINGHTETASRNSKKCESPPVPQGNDSPQALVLVAAAAGVVVVGGGTSGWMVRRRRHRRG
jgi:hypothetical protein